MQKKKCNLCMLSLEQVLHVTCIVADVALCQQGSQENGLTVNTTLEIPPGDLDLPTPDSEDIDSLEEFKLKVLTQLS